MLVMITTVHLTAFSQENQKGKPIEQKYVFRTRDSNIRSQKALLRLGARHEGILRWDRMNDDGSYRDTYIYSIIRPEWSSLKANLLKKLL